jgi:hypothetical protein
MRRLNLSRLVLLTQYLTNVAVALLWARFQIETICNISQMIDHGNRRATK